MVGAGGEGEVWDARDTLGRRRALKLVRPDALAEPGEVVRRGRWLVRIDHPALVRVDRAGILRGGGLDGWGFVEMAFVDGPSLHTAAPDPTALDELRGVADALDALHAGAWSDGTPLVHRDVKPANLVRGPEGLVLVDVSSLRGVDASNRTAIGTPAFAAPEVFRGRGGPPADRFALAATAVALLTGARGDALTDLVMNPDEALLPAGVRAALASDPRKRPSTCVEVLEVAIAAADEVTAVLPRLRLIGPEVDDLGDPEARPGDAPHGAMATWIDPEPPVPPESEPGAIAGLHATAADDAGWGPEQGEVGADAPRGRAGVWLAWLVAVLAVPAVAVAAGWTLTPALGAAGAVHLGAFVTARRHRALAVVAPPLAWGWLLGPGLAGGRRRRVGAVRAWVAGAVGVAIGTWAALIVTEPAGIEAVPGTTWTAGTVVGLAALGVAVGAARARGFGGLVLRILGLVPWALGAVLVLAGSVVALVPMAASGRARVVLGAAGAVLAGAVEVLRGPSAEPPTPPPESAMGPPVR